MKFAGFTPFTSLDFPGKLTFVVFSPGCPWRCRYCQNAHLWTFSAGPDVPWEDLRAMIKARVGFIDAVTFSGGEPTAYSDLRDYLWEVRSLGLSVGLHTAGPFPDRLEAVLPLCDWVGFDVKAPFDDRYERITGVKRSHEPALESLKLLLASGVPHEIRTTVHPRLLSPGDLEDLDNELQALGAGPTKRQPFSARGCVDTELVDSCPQAFTNHQVLQ
jgi:pyruvate formate lyase activating enzyme